MRSYDEYCAIAKSLDVVGDRWTLLIVRELAGRGPCRYTDLRYGLPGIATNLLADRLRELERAGVVEREDAPPPIATTLFRLTPRGEELRPLLADLARWGVPLMIDERPGDAVRSHWLATALELILADRRPDGSPVTIEIQTAERPIVIEARDGAIHIRLGPADNADARITGPHRAIMGLLLGIIDLPGATANGVNYEGDPAILDRIGADLAHMATPH
jgi:DNA-binding HxlR family transcriptional regulator